MIVEYRGLNSTVDSLKNDQNKTSWYAMVEILTEDWTFISTLGLSFTRNSMPRNASYFTRKIVLVQMRQIYR